MIAAQRFEIAPPPPAIDVGGEDLTSGSTTWTALPDLGETTLSAASSRRELDHMHARYRSPLTSRFLSTDPVGGRPKQPQSWNRYAYTRGNPLRLIDPDGRLDRDAQKELARIKQGETAQGIERTECDKCRNLILGLASPVAVLAAGGAVASLPIAGAATAANAAVFSATVNGVSNAASHPDRAGEALFTASAVGFVEGLAPPAGAIPTAGKIFLSSLATNYALGDSPSRASVGLSAVGAVTRSRLAFGGNLPGVGGAERAVLETADRVLETLFSATGAAVDLLEKE